MALIRGRVVDREGNPVAGARVMVAEGPAPVPDVALLSGSDGSFVLAVPVPGRWRLMAASDTASVMADVSVAAAADEARCTLELSGS